MISRLNELHCARKQDQDKQTLDSKVGEVAWQQVRTKSEHDKQVKHDEQHDNQAEFKPRKPHRYRFKLHWEEDHNKFPKYKQVIDWIV